MSSNLRPVLSRQICQQLLGGANPETLDVKQAMFDLQGVPLPVIAFGCKNPLGVHQVPWRIYESWASGASPTSRQLYTVPAGFKLWVDHISIQQSTTTASVLIKLRDGIADSADIELYAPVPATAGVQVRDTGLREITSGVRVDAGDQTANTTYFVNMCGWLESLI